MEYYIENITDITYVSELILDIEDVKDLIHRRLRLRLTSLRLRKSSVH